MSGLSNDRKQLMVAGVDSISAQGGRVSLVHTQAWARNYGRKDYYWDRAVKVRVDPWGDVVVTGCSVGLNAAYDFATIKYHPDGTALWTNRYDGPDNLADQVGFLAFDGQGNVYIAGESANAEPGTDIVLVKYARDGVPLWTNRLNMSAAGYSSPADLAVDRPGNAFLLVDTPYEAPDQFITVKYGPSGDLLWTNYYRISAEEDAYRVATDSAGNAIVTGLSSISGEGSYAVTIKYAGDGTAGTALWTNRYLRPYGAYPRSIIVDGADNIIVAGETPGSAHQFFAMKYSSSGASLWTNTVAGPSGYQRGGEPLLAVNRAGELFLTGDAKDAELHKMNFATVKFTGDGVALWTNHISSTNISDSFPVKTATDNAGNFYLTGYSAPPAGGNWDCFVVKSASDGALVWTNRLQSSGKSYAYQTDMVVDGKGNLYVTGVANTTNRGSEFLTIKFSDYLSYAPPTNFIGYDSFSFVVTDNLGQRATGTVAVVVGGPKLFATNNVIGSNGFAFQGQRAGAPGLVVMEASTNLVHWEPIFIYTSTGDAWQFYDPEATNFPARFYRALQQ